MTVNHSDLQRERTIGSLTINLFIQGDLVMQNLAAEILWLELLIYIFLAGCVVSVVYGAFNLAGMFLDIPDLSKKAHGVVVLFLCIFVLGYAALTANDDDLLEMELSRLAVAIKCDNYTIRNFAGSERLVMVYTSSPAETEKGGILMRRESLDNFVKLLGDKTISTGLAKR